MAVDGIWSDNLGESDRELIERHKQFCQEFLVDLDQTAAYRRVYTSSTYKSASSAASKLMRDPRIQAYIKSLMQAQRDELSITSAEIIKELTAIGFTRASDFVTWDNDGRATFKSSEEISDRADAAIKDISFIRNTETGTNTVTFKTHSKVQALKMVGDYMGTFDDIYRAIQTLLRFGFAVRKTEWGYLCIDLEMIPRPRIFKTEWGVAIVSNPSQLPDYALGDDREEIVLD